MFLASMERPVANARRQLRTSRDSQIVEQSPFLQQRSGGRSGRISYTHPVSLLEQAGWNLHARVSALRLLLPDLQHTYNDSSWQRGSNKNQQSRERQSNKNNYASNFSRLDGKETSPDAPARCQKHYNVQLDRSPGPPHFSSAKIMYQVPQQGRKDPEQLCCNALAYAPHLALSRMLATSGWPFTKARFQGTLFLKARYLNGWGLNCCPLT